VKFGVVYNTAHYGVDSDAIVAYAKHAEDCGFESFYLPEHIVGAGDENGVSFDGEFYSFANLSSFPKPYQSRTLPIHVGGSTRAAARRAGLRGDGYFPGGSIGAKDRAAQIELMRATALEAGRDAAALEVTRWGSIDMSARDAEAYAAGGTNRIVVGTAAADREGQLEEMSAFAERFKLHARLGRDAE
jgi:alkanesulfonate monooxygenase SsuD/methylene tetrahydromethanopterin reductase-like flavin-dependent oxidoreductase (luciferase family)